MSGAFFGIIRSALTILEFRMNTQKSSAFVWIAGVLQSDFNIFVLFVENGNRLLQPFEEETALKLRTVRSHKGLIN